MVWYGVIWYGVILYGMIWYGTVRYGTVRISRHNIKIVFHLFPFSPHPLGLPFSRPLLVHIRGAKEFLAYFRALEQVTHVIMPEEGERAREREIIRRERGLISCFNILLAEARCFGVRSPHLMYDIIYMTCILVSVRQLDISSKLTSKHVCSKQLNKLLD